MERAAIVGADWIDPEADAPPAGSLLVEAGRIAGFAPPDAALEGWRRIDRTGARIAPGFIDLHFHGALVHASPERFRSCLEEAARTRLREGTTAFLATTVCWPDARLEAAIARLSEAVAGDVPGGAACLGVHLEGPWISPDALGAMDSTAVRPFDPARDLACLDRLEDRLRMVTLAPELPGADALLATLTARGVLAALGHSRASPAQIDAAVEGGIRHVTHLWNAMGPLHHREPGVPGTVLADDRLHCDLICDGHHVAPSVVRLSARALGNRLVLITDRIEPAETGESALGAAQAAGPDAPFRRPDGTLVGSQLTLDRAVGNLTRFAGSSLRDAVAAASLRPARLLGEESERGTLRVGARADFAVIGADGRVRETWLGGEPVWTRPTPSPR